VDSFYPYVQTNCAGYTIYGGLLSRIIVSLKWYYKPRI
jgi:hypothetical protein